MCPADNNIPKYLDYAVRYLKENLAEWLLLDINKYEEPREFVASVHLGLGMGLRNSWGLWRCSRLAKWFNKQGIHHPDDMSSCILTALWCDINDGAFSIEENARYYQAYWAKKKK